MNDTKGLLTFRPNTEDEKFLESKLRENGWSEIVRTWIKQDKKLSKKEIMDKIKNDLILIYMGLLVFGFSYVVTIIWPSHFIVIIFFFTATIAITYGSFSIIWELKLNARRK